MNKQAHYWQAIQKACPDLEATSIAFNRQGQNSDVIVVNHEFVFRFPKYDQVLEQLKVETAVLQHIQDRLPLAVPAPLFINLEQKSVGEAFIGYRLIPGQPLWPETFRSIKSQAALQSAADQVAAFLKALHGTAVAEPLRNELAVRDTYREIVGVYGRIQQKLFSYMRPDAQAWAAGHFETFLNDANHFTYEPVLKHGDFGPSNILFDQEKQTITGIIDFGGSGLGDPAYDFAGLLSGYGQAFIHRCRPIYPEVIDFMERIRFYQGTFALLEALFGIENNDEAAFQAGLERYV